MIVPYVCLKTVFDKLNEVSLSLVKSLLTIHQTGPLNPVKMKMEFSHFAADHMLCVYDVLIMNDLLIAQLRLYKCRPAPPHTSNKFIPNTSPE